MIEKLLKSKTMARVLGLLLFSGPLHLREIARRIDTSPVYVQKELKNLEELGLASNQRIGNLSVWEINRSAALYPEIKSIYLKTDGLGEVLGEMVKGTGIRFAVIYGSFAKGTESQKSDIDLFLVGSTDEKRFIGEIAKAEEKIGREINYIMWSEGEFAKNARGGHHLLLNILKNPVIWVKGEEHEFRKAFG